MAGVLFNVGGGGNLFGDAAMRGLQSGYGFTEAIRENQRQRKKQEEEDAFTEGLKRTSAEALGKLTPDLLQGMDDREAAIRKAEAVADAQAEWAIQHGRMDVFGQHFAASANMREFRRGKAFAMADRAFNMSKDFNAYVPALNAIDDGKKVLGFLDRGNGMLDVSFEENGKKRTQRMSADDALRMINADRDPAAARAQELQFRLEKHKADLKKAEEAHKARWQAWVKHQEQLGAMGTRNPQFTTAGPGQVALQDGVPIFQNVAPDWAGAAGGDPAREREVKTAQRNLIKSIILSTPELKEELTMGGGTTFTPRGAEVNLRANQILDNNPGVNEADAVEIATKGQLVDKGPSSGGPAIIYTMPGGKRREFPLFSAGAAPAPGAVPAHAQQPRPAVAGPGSPMASDARPPGFPVVTPQQQAELDAGRRQLLEDELAREQDPAARAALQRELAATPTAPTAAQAIAGQAAAVDGNAQGAARHSVRQAEQQAAAAESAAPAPADAAREQIGQRVDAARKTLRVALAKRSAYGLKQRRDDPDGFAAIEKEVAAARAALKAAEAEWMGALGPQANQVFARPTAASVIAGR